MQKDWDARAVKNAYHWVNSTKDTWNKDEYYESGVKVIQEHILPFFQKHNIQEKDVTAFSVLDIGCGTGRLCRALAQICGHITGIDVSSEMIEKAKQDNGAIENITFLLTSGTDIQEIESNKIDFCFSFIVFQHIPSKTIIQSYFKEIVRVLKSGSRAKFQVRGVPGNPPGKIVWFKGLKNRYIALTLWRGCIPLPWTRRYNTVFGACYTKKELQRDLRKAGFEEVNVFHQNERYLWAEVRKPQ